MLRQQWRLKQLIAMVGAWFESEVYRQLPDEHGTPRVGEVVNERKLGRIRGARIEQRRLVLPRLPLGGADCLNRRGVPGEPPAPPKEPRSRWVELARNDFSANAWRRRNLGPATSWWFIRRRGLWPFEPEIGPAFRPTTGESSVAGVSQSLTATFIIVLMRIAGRLAICRLATGT
jgi:hypothetical protein